MSYEVTPGNITWVCHRALQSVDGQFNTGEVIMGLTEALGRVVVQSSDTPVQGGQCLQVIVNHLNATMHAGFTAKGYDMGPLNG